MAWISKFSGLPTATDIPDVADGYAGGVFTIDTATSATHRDWNSTGGNTNAPRAYADLTTIGASINHVLRVTGRCSAVSIASEFNSRRGVALYGPNSDDACLAFIEEPDPVGTPGTGFGYGRAEENGTTNSIGPDPLTACGAPNQFRLYWNGTSDAFVIPDAGFGSYSVPANTVSYWYSEDDGTTWVRVGDRAIAVGVAPTRAALWAGIDAATGEVLTTTFTTLEVMQLNSPPYFQKKRPGDDDTYHDVAQNLYVEIVDEDSDIVAASVIIEVNGDVAWTGDAQQAGFTVTKTPITKGYSYDINPSTDLVDGREYSIRVYVEDTVPNAVDETWLFTAGDLRIGPAEDQSENVPPRTELGFSDMDSDGADLSDYFESMGTVPGWMPDGVGYGPDVPGPVGTRVTFHNQRRQGPDPTLSFNPDDYAFHINHTGPVSHLLSIALGLETSGAGVSVVNPLNAQPEMVDSPTRMPAHAGAEDDYDFPISMGGKQYHNYPRLARGIVISPRDVVAGDVAPQEEAAAEDGVFYSLADPHDYAPNVDDGDGNALTGGYGIEQVRAFVAAADDWASPGAGFYGYGQDGVLRHNGLTTLPGVFGAGVGQFNRRGWSDNQGLLASGNIDGNAAMVGVDQLRINSVGLSGWVQEFVESAHRWYLTGDFEIEVSFASYAATASSWADARFHLFSDAGYGCFVGRRGDGYYQRYTLIAGSYGNQVTAATSDTSGKLKISRVGSTVRQFYWDGVSTWIEIGSGIDLGRSDPMFVRFLNTGDGPVNVDVTWSGFQILSGSWTNKASWAEEAFSTERGNLDSFPDSVLAVGTDQSLDIIDTDTDLLWMRFIKGTGNVLHNDIIIPMDSRFADGILVAALRSDANNEGSVAIIDFNLDVVRILREDVSAVTGGFYDAPSNVGSAQGRARVIAGRNDALGWTDDYNRYATQDYKHSGVALLISSGKVYIVSGNDDGLRIFRYTRWLLQAGAAGSWIDQPDYSSWVPTQKVWWCWFRPQDDMLFWTADDAGDATIYSQALASMETPMHGGAFVAADEKVMPGSRSYPGQYKPAINGADVYVAADDAVWTMTWPGSSWSRFLGIPGSGATYELLPADLTRITTVQHMKDGSLDLLAVGVDTGVTSQVIVFRLDIGTLYAKTELIGARSNSSLVAA